MSSAIFLSGQVKPAVQLITLAIMIIIAPGTSLDLSTNRFILLDFIEP